MDDGQAALLEVRGLGVEFAGGSSGNPVLDGVDLTIRRGEIVALVGESGSGKSVTALSLMRLLPADARITGGSVLLDGEDLLRLSNKQMKQVRGRRIAMLFQQPKAMLDPTAKVGGQVGEPLRLHRGLSRSAARERTVQLLRDVGIPEPDRRAHAYAHQLSGGMAQRVMIACALSGEPDLLIADEPTTALDVTVEAQILALLRRKRSEAGLSILLITHDLGIVSAMADRVVVMYAGRIVEHGPARSIFSRPRHPYTQALLRCSLLIPGSDGRVVSIPGSALAAQQIRAGCRFRPRCTVADELGVADMAEREEPGLFPVGPDHEARCWAVADQVVKQEVRT
jgi:peptide/nickel transport system ATP-binding protein